MKRDGITLVRSIYRANKAKDKTEYLENFLDDYKGEGVTLSVVRHNNDGEASSRALFFLFMVVDK